MTLVFVADLARERGEAGQRREWAFADTGFISQNAYLYCAPEGLVTGVHAPVDRAALISKLKLRSDQLIVLAQSVGYPKL